MDYITSQDMLGFFPEFDKYLNTVEARRNFDVFSARLSQFADIQNVFQNITQINNMSNSYGQSETITASLVESPSTLSLEINQSPANGIGFSRNNSGFFNALFGSISPDISQIMELACTPKSDVRLVVDDSNLTFLKNLTKINLNNKDFDLSGIEKDNERDTFSYKNLLGDIHPKSRKDFTVTFGSNGTGRQLFYRFLIPSLMDANSGSISPAVPDEFNGGNDKFLGFVFYPPRYGDETWGDQYGVYASTTWDKTPVAMYISGRRYPLGTPTLISGVRHFFLNQVDNIYSTGASPNVPINADTNVAIQYTPLILLGKNFKGDEAQGRWLITFTTQEKRDNAFGANKEVTAFQYATGSGDDFEEPNKTALEKYQFPISKQVTLNYEAQTDLRGTDYTYETTGGVRVFEGKPTALISYLRFNSTGDDEPSLRGKWTITFAGGSTKEGIFGNKDVSHFVYQVGRGEVREVAVQQDTSITHAYALVSTTKNDPDPPELTVSDDITIKYAFKYTDETYSFGDTYALRSSALTEDPANLPTGNDIVRVNYNFDVYDSDDDLTQPAYSSDFNMDINLYRTASFSADRITQPNTKKQINVEFSGSSSYNPDFLGYGEGNLSEIDLGATNGRPSDFFQDLSQTKEVKLNGNLNISINNEKYLQALQVAHIAQLSYFVPSGGAPSPFKNVNVGGTSSNFIFDQYWDKTKYGKLLAFILRQSGLVGLSISSPRY